MQKPVTHDQRLREARGETRATADRLYDRTRRRKDPRLKRSATIRDSARWQRLRAKKRRLNPLCEVHEARGDTVVATGVDHTKPLETHPHLAFVWFNLKSLCDPCHAKKSAAERRGGEARRRGAADGAHGNDQRQGQGRGHMGHGR